MKSVIPRLMLLLLVISCLVSCESPPNPTQENTPQPASLCYQQFGVTLSGAEGVDSDYTPPTIPELKYYASKGVKLIRVEIRWDIFQPTLNGPLDQDQLDWLRGYITQANDLKMTVDIDLHQRSDYDDLNFSDSLPILSLVNFWGKMAAALKNVDGICGFGIANEPNHDSDFLGSWPPEANAVIAAISQVDKQPFIFVGEDNWDSSSQWDSNQANQIMDTPTHQVVFEAHSYWDRRTSGRYKPDIPPASDSDAKQLVTNNLSPFFTWCHKSGRPCMVGEYGVPPDKTWLAALDYGLSYMKNNHITGVYWAGGSGYNDILSIEPKDNGQDRAQMGVLAKYLSSSS